MKKIIFGFFLCLSLFFIPLHVNTAGIELSIAQAQDFSIMPEASCTRQGLDEYSFCDFLRLGLNVGQILLYLSGTAVMVMIVIGSALFVTSTGNSSKIQQGKDIIMAAITGLLIVVFAYEIVGAVFVVMLPTEDDVNFTRDKDGEIQDDFWDKGWWDFEAILQNHCECPLGSEKKNGLSN